MASIESNIAFIKTEISKAANRAGRNPDSIEILAATKTVEKNRIVNALEAGIKLFGENRVQEAAQKFSPKPDKAHLHMIGHLQRNKAKMAVDLFDCVESIDKIETAAALERHCLVKKRPIDVLLEVNTSGELSKSGFRTDEDLYRSLDDLLNLKMLKIRGLMTIGPFTSDEIVVRSAFANLRDLFERLSARIGRPSFDTLSMGMSSDFIWAVEEGATRIRLGSVLFGERQ